MAEELKKEICSRDDAGSDVAAHAHLKMQSTLVGKNVCCNLLMPISIRY